MQAAQIWTIRARHRLQGDSTPKKDSTIFALLALCEVFEGYLCQKLPLELSEEIFVQFRSKRTTHLTPRKSFFVRQGRRYRRSSKKYPKIFLTPTAVNNRTTTNKLLVILGDFIVALHSLL